jgi:hypothetical protein
VIRAVVALALIAACDRSTTRAPSGSESGAGSGSGSASAAGSNAPLIIATKSSSGSNHDVRNPDTLPNPIPATSRQLITAVIDDWRATHARVQLWTRADAKTAWTAAGESWPAVIGKNGAAWGSGLHGAPGETTLHDGPRIVASAPGKSEGDGKAPAGAFRLRGAYGYGRAAPAGTKLPYTPADKLECVDDTSSLHYTRILDGTKTERDWKSSEQMRRTDHLYTWVIDIAHNPGHAPGGGSCIFFHVWGGPDATTVGCTAMADDKLVALLKQLDPAVEPIYVLLPRAEYAALAPIWNLPPL